LYTGLQNAAAMPTSDFDTLKKPERELAAFLDSTSAHKLIAAFLREHGKFFQPRLLPKGIRGGQIKACYANSYRLLNRHGKRLGHAYVEGYALSDLLNVHLHAWCVDGHGNVYDRTWNTGQAYFGVALKANFVNREIRQRKADGDLYFGFLDDWNNGWPLITQLADQPDLWKHQWECAEQ
jgi:hypothetical protein